MNNKLADNRNFNDVSMIAFKYGNSPISIKNVFYDSNTDGEIDISWLFFLINYEDRHILVDVGNGNIDIFNAYGFKMRNFYMPSALLYKYGLAPDDITDIFITHADFDHIGDMSIYKNADVYIQENELESCHDLMVHNKKIITFSSSITVMNKFLLLCVGGHTKGSSIVQFETGGLKYVLGGDACYVNANLEQQIPTGRTCNIEQSRKFISMYNGPDFRVYFSHEPSIVEEDEQIKEIITRN